MSCGLKLCHGNRRLPEKSQKIKLLFTNCTVWTKIYKNKLEMNFKPNKHEFDKILRMEICIGKVGRKVLNRSYESGLESREEF